MRRHPDHAVAPELARQVNELDHLAGLAGIGECDDAVAAGNQAEVAMRGLARMDEHRRGPGRAQHGSELARGEPRLAHAGGDDLSRTALDLEHGPLERLIDRNREDGLRLRLEDLANLPLNVGHAVPCPPGRTPPRSPSCRPRNHLAPRVPRQEACSFRF